MKASFCLSHNFNLPEGQRVLSWMAASRQGGIPFGIGMGAVAIRVVLGVSATTEGCRFMVSGVGFPVSICPRNLFLVRGEDFLLQRRVSIYKIRTSGHDVDFVFFVRLGSTGFDGAFGCFHSVFSVVFLSYVLCG